MFGNIIAYLFLQLLSKISYVRRKKSKKKSSERGGKEEFVRPGGEKRREKARKSHPKEAERKISSAREE